jgi:hypothetical protein
MLMYIAAVEPNRRFNEFISRVRPTTFLYLFLVILSVATSTYFVHLAITNRDNYGYSTIMPSFVLSSGSCTQIELLSEGLLIFLNIIGGLCLGISNYLQQLCTSPNEDDIAYEMEKRGDVDFGANSLSSIFRRMFKRKLVYLLWVLFVLTSLPSHLLLNGTIGLAPTYIVPAIGAVGLNMSSEYMVGDQLSWMNITGRSCNSLMYNIQNPGSTGSLDQMTVEGAWPVDRRQSNHKPPWHGTVDIPLT